MKKLILTSAILFIAISAQSSFGQLNKKFFVEDVKVLEQKPLSDDAKESRANLLKWLITTDEVSVTLCGDVMALNPEKKNKFKSELMAHFMFGQAVYKIENPTKATDEKAAALAGVEAMLRTYEAMLATNSKAKNEELDALVAKQKAGQLGPVVDAANCSGK